MYVLHNLFFINIIIKPRYNRRIVIEGIIGKLLGEKIGKFIELLKKKFGQPGKAEPSDRNRFKLI